MRVTEIKNVKIDRDCKNNPVFVSWFNTLGGREHWLFFENQTEGLQTREGGTFEPFIEDLEESRGQIEDITIKAQPQLILYAMVDAEDMAGLKTILYSLKVEQLMNPDTWQQEGLDWQIIRPVQGSFKIIDTNQLRNTIEIVFNDPYINNQSQ